MKNIYIVKIEKKYFSRLLKYHIYITKIKKYKDYYLLYLDFSNYQKILKFKNIYHIEFVGYSGFIKYKNIIKKEIVFFMMFTVSLIYIIFLSKVIFLIEVKTTDQDIQNLIMDELNKNGIGLYRFSKSFKDKELIRKKILDDNKDKLEWMEITRVGSSYVVHVEKRIINNIETDTTPRDIVALKNAIILSIDATSGSIQKKLNDYVKKGDIIVTGTITHKDKVVDLVRANAVIYGETWYNVHVSYPMAYYEKVYTGNTKKRLSATFLNKKINFSGSFKEEEIIETKLLYHDFLPIKFSLEEVKEVVLIDDVYTVEEAIHKAILEAKEKLLKNLPEDSKVLSQKKLKIIVNDSTIDIDVFFKVYENITDTREISVEGE